MGVHLDDSSHLALLRDVAERVARAAGDYALGLYRTHARQGVGPLPGAVRGESDPPDLVTEADRQIEEFIGLRLASERPGDVIAGEQTTVPSPTPGQVVWVVDPLAGRTNYGRGLREWAVSIAALRDGIPLVGAVYAPALGELWSAARGHGALRVDSSGYVSALRANDTTELSEVVFGTGFSYQVSARRRQGRVLARAVGLIHDVRRIGSPALDLCWVAEGALDVYVEHCLHPWDWAAGALIAVEAGAVVSVPGRAEAGEPSLRAVGDPVFAAAPGIAAQVIALLRETKAAQIPSA